MTRKKLILILVASTALSALALSAARARDVPKVATGFVANVVCTETFVSGLDPARIFAETMSVMPGTGLISWALDYKVDRVRKDVTVTLLGLPEGWAALASDGRYKQEGEIAGQFWHVVGMCRFGSGELDPYLPTVRRLPLDAEF